LKGKAILKALQSKWVDQSDGDERVKERFEQKPQYLNPPRSLISLSLSKKKTDCSPRVVGQKGV